MINPSGSVTFNGINDSEMERIWGFKAKNPTGFSFNPQQIQTAMAPQGGVFYNAVTFQWNGEVGLRVIHEILTYLLKKEERTEAGS